MRWSLNGCKSLINLNSLLEWCAIYIKVTFQPSSTSQALRLNYAGNGVSCENEQNEQKKRFELNWKSLRCLSIKISTEFAVWGKRLCVQYSMHGFPFSSKYSFHFRCVDDIYSNFIVSPNEPKGKNYMKLAYSLRVSVIWSDCMGTSINHPGCCRVFGRHNA